jgi:hypothetical protein
MKNKTPFHNLPALAIALAAALATGCAALNEVRFPANPSPLDYAQFRIARPSPADGKPETIRLDLSGGGFLEITTGASERVSDGFWKQSDNPDWQDIRRDHAFLSAEETTAVFQRLVDAGLFDRQQDPKKNPPPHELAVLASIGFRKKLVLTSRPEYRQIFDMLLERVNHP